MPYGDQGLFVRREAFERAGGFGGMAICEDVDFVRRLRRMGRIVTLPMVAITSGRRWRQRGAVRATLVNQLVLAGHLLGTPGEWLRRIYA